MKYKDVIEILRTSEPTDWLHDDQRGIYTFKDNLNLRIEKKEREMGERNKFEGEDWATKHPDPNAYRVICEVYYGASFIEERMLVAVDGYRAILPLPEFQKKSIPKDDYRFARIIDQDRRIDEYIQRSGLEVADA